MGCPIHTCKKFYLTFVVIVIALEAIGCSQVEVAKKYGKRFGNKNKANSTTADTKETDKSLTKAAASDITKTSVTTTLSPPINRNQRYSYSKIQTTSTPAPSAPTTTAKSDAEQDEVDVDLSQLQVSLPNVKFDCSSRSEGYYGDPDYRCEVFHYCSANGKRDTFLCPSNSKFNQKDMTCDTDAVEDLCQSEVTWSTILPNPPQTDSNLSHLSPVELNKNNNNLDKVQIEVNGPKDNSIREPVFEAKPSREEIRRGLNGGQSSDNKQDNNQSKDNYFNNNNNNNESGEDNRSNANNKDVKYNYFGGSFGERQRTNGVTAGTAIATNANDQHSSKINANNNNNSNLKNHMLANDFGTASDAIKKVHKEVENGLAMRATSGTTSGANAGSRMPAPLVVTLSTVADSVQQTFQSNGFSFSKPVMSQTQDSGAVTNANQIFFENTRPEHHMPSTVADKSFLMPPLKPTDATPVEPNVRIFSNFRHTAPVQALRAKHNNRPNHETFSTERIRFESPTLAPPLARHVRPDTNRKNVFEQKPIEIWAQQEPIGNYEPAKYSPTQQEPPRDAVAKPGPPKHIQVENTDIFHQNWSPIGLSSYSQDQQTNYKSVRPKQENKPKPTPLKNWNSLEPQPQTQTQNEPDIHVQNRDKAYAYPTVQHTINPTLVDNHLWSDDGKPQQQMEVDYRPVKEATNVFKVQNSGPPPKPKWAQDLTDQMEEMPHTQTMTAPNQPLMTQSSQMKKWRNGVSNESSRNRKPMKLAKPETFESLPLFSGLEFNEGDLFGLKTGLQPMTKHVTTGAGQVNLFYDQFKPYAFAENNPTEYVKKANDNHKQLDSQSMEVRVKHKTKNTGLKTMSEETPTLVDELKMEKEMMHSKRPSYVPEILSEEEFPITIPETHIIPKLHKSKSKGLTIKHNPHRYRPSKQSFMPSSGLTFEDLIAGADNSWALKQLESSGLEASFSHHYPMMPSMSYPHNRPKMVKYPKHSFSSMPSPNRFVFGAPIPAGPRMPPQAVHHPQPTFFMPPPMPFMSPMQAQATIPVPFYMPYVPQPQQSVASNPNTSNKAKSVSKPKSNQSKSKSNSPKIIRL